MIKFIENLLKSPPPQFDGEIIDYKPLGEVCELKNGYTPSKSKPEFWEDGDIPWFRMEDIRTNGRILSDSIQHITREAVKGVNFSLRVLLSYQLPQLSENTLYCFAMLWQISRLLMSV